MKFGLRRLEHLLPSNSVGTIRRDTSIRRDTEEQYAEVGSCPVRHLCVRTGSFPLRARGTIRKRFFCCEPVVLFLLLYLMSIASSKVTHTGSIQVHSARNAHTLLDPTRFCHLSRLVTHASYGGWRADGDSAGPWPLSLFCLESFWRKPRSRYLNQKADASFLVSEGRY
jgi:hypothetical protein